MKQSSETIMSKLKMTILTNKKTDKMNHMHDAKMKIFVT